mmetsp:Transcript_21339/g.51256  ORF Transcript_21339/g.51256 Transcript_21339/m.51256 type:complete len:651 (+) Transcript_21339:351-2303(+)
MRMNVILHLPNGQRHPAQMTNTFQASQLAYVEGRENMLLFCNVKLSLRTRRLSLRALMSTRRSHQMPCPPVRAGGAQRPFRDARMMEPWPRACTSLHYSTAMPRRDRRSRLAPPTLPFARLRLGAPLGLRGVRGAARRTLCSLRLAAAPPRRARRACVGRVGGGRRHIGRCGGGCGGGRGGRHGGRGGDECRDGREPRSGRGGEHAEAQRGRGGGRGGGGARCGGVLRGGGRQEVWEGELEDLHLHLEVHAGRLQSLAQQREQVALLDGIGEVDGEVGQVALELSDRHALQLLFGEERRRGRSGRHKAASRDVEVYHIVTKVSLDSLCRRALRLGRHRLSPRPLKKRTPHRGGGASPLPALQQCTERGAVRRLAGLDSRAADRACVVRAQPLEEAAVVEQMAARHLRRLLEVREADGAASALIARHAAVEALNCLLARGGRARVDRLERAVEQLVEHAARHRAGQTVHPLHRLRDALYPPRVGRLRKAESREVHGLEHRRGGRRLGGGGGGGAAARACEDAGDEGGSRAHPPHALALVCLGDGGHQLRDSRGKCSVHHVPEQRGFGPRDSRGLSSVGIDARSGCPPCHCAGVRGGGKGDGRREQSRGECIPKSWGGKGKARGGRGAGGCRVWGMRDESVEGGLQAGRGKR